MAPVLLNDATVSLSVVAPVAITLRKHAGAVIWVVDPLLPG